ncbi:histamine N-methyltransferase-like [Glandiceps talaboti]
MEEKSPSWRKILTDLEHLEWYGRTFTVYTSHTDRQIKTDQFCTNVIPQIVMDNYSTSDTVDADRKSTVFKYLGIGSGAGMPDINILKEIKNSVTSIQATIVDPCQHLIDQFKQNIAKEGCHLHGVTFDFRLTTLEEYRNDCEGATFDCIAGINVLYYFDYLYETISWLHSVLTKNGTLVFLISDAESIFPRTWQASSALTSKNQKVVYYAMVEECLTKIGAQGVKRLNVTADIDITEFLEDISVEGDMLIDFIAHSVNFRATAPPTLVTSILKFWEGMAVKRDDRIYANNNFDFIVAKK